jgi:hypothetical protein
MVNDKRFLMWPGDTIYVASIDAPLFQYGTARLMGAAGLQHFI